MRILLILGLCATAMVANAQTGKTEIVNKYVIDAEPVYDFNGSQLNGKTVVNYKVDTMPPLPSGDKVIIIHQIQTSDFKAPDGPTIKVSVEPDGGMPVIIVDGVEALAPPAPEDIVSIEIFDPGSEKGQKYGEKGKNGVMYITTKKLGVEAAEQIVIIDGKKSTEAELKAMDSKKIESVTVLKGKAAKDYTDNPNVGVLIVKTKKK